MNFKPFRQGDVLLVPVRQLPAGATEAARDAHDRIVLAEGEQSGHAHTFRAKEVTAFRVETAEADANRALVDYVVVGGAGPARLAHEYADGQKADHEPIDLPPGAYRVVQQREESVDVTTFRKEAPRPMLD